MATTVSAPHGDMPGAPRSDHASDVPAPQPNPSEPQRPEPVRRDPQPTVPPREEPPLTDPDRREPPAEVPPATEPPRETPPTMGLQASQRLVEPELTPAPPEPPVRGPLRHVLRAVVVLVLLGFLAYILQSGIVTAFMANPGLNGLIVGVLGVGILLALVEFGRLARAASVATRARREGEVAPLARNSIMSPLAPVLSRSAPASTAVEAVSLRLDEGRDTLRYMAGLLVFLGLLGTFWGLLETVGSVGNAIRSLRTGTETGVLFDELKSGLAAPLSGMGISFSSSLFGIAGSLVLGFLDLQIGQAQRRMRTDVEDWVTSLSAGGTENGAPLAALTQRLDRLLAQMGENTGARSSNAAMANLAEGIQGLVQHMRSEQQMIRDWVEAQAGRERELKRLLDRLAERERLL